MIVLMYSNGVVAVLSNEVAVAAAAVAFAVAVAIAVAVASNGFAS